ncbi:MAG: hypothetical protein WAX29_12400, partial [Propionibacterium sp.]
MSEAWKGRPGTATETDPTTTFTASIVPPEGIDPWLDMFVRRVIADALNEASARYWEHRAEVLADAAPKPGEFHGQATAEELSAAWRRCHRDAARCRQHAGLLRDHSVSAARDDWAACLDRE